MDMMDGDLQTGLRAATGTTLVAFPFNSACDSVPPESEQDSMLGLNVDHNDPLAWINFWPG